MGNFMTMGEFSIIQKIQLYCLVILAILSCLALGNDDSTLAPRWIHGILTVFSYLSLLLLAYCTRYRFITKEIVIAVIALLSLFLLRNINVAYGSFPMGGFYDSVILLLFFFIDDNVKAKALCLFRLFLLCISVLGVICYFSFILKIGLPYTLVPYYSEAGGFYVNYYFTYLLYDEPYLRLCGVFNEPGYFGTVLALMLVNNLNNIRLKGNIVMLIAGCLTMSMAFWVIILIGVVLSSIKNIKALFISGSCMLILLITVNTVQFENKNITYLLGRFQIDNNTGKIKGNNRTSSSFDNIEKDFRQNGDKLFGFGNGYCNLKNIKKTSSIKKYFVEWGYLGVILSYGLIMFAALLRCKHNLSAYIYWFCFLVSIYQRPNIFTTAYFLLLFGGIIKLNQERNESPAKVCGLIY